MARVIGQISNFFLTFIATQSYYHHLPFHRDVSVGDHNHGVT